MDRPGVKYSRLANEKPAESVFDFESVFDYPEDDKQFKSTHSYGSAFKYRSATGEACAYSSIVNGKPTLPTHLMHEVEHADPGTNFLLLFTSWFLTTMSYIFFALTIPVSYWFLVKKMGEFDRLVVFRLGKMIGVKGPGRFIVFPWMDRTKRIDVRASAFAVPPQQFITCDGGIVEMGAEIQFGIVDVVTMISEVADHQEILRSLGKTVLIKLLVKKTVTQLEKDKRTPESEIVDELNDQVRKWGIDVHSVKLSETKVLKQPESGSNSAVGSILKGLGMKDDPKYPSPQEFVRATHGLDGTEGTTSSLLGSSNNPLAGLSAPAGGGATDAAAAIASSMNMGLLQSISQGQQVQLGPGVVAGPGGIVATPTGIKDTPPSNWGRCLEVIMASEFSVVEEDAHGVYKLEISETENGTDTYYIQLTATQRSILEECPEGKSPDVSVSISSSDLASVLEGSLAPLQAYLTGRIQASGDVRKLMLFDKLSRRGHKAGSMFSV